VRCEEATDGGMEVAPGVWAPGGALRFGFARSGGPGGQNVNKVNTKAEVWVAAGALRGLTGDARERLKKLAGRRLTREGEIHIAAETARTQEGNRAAALERLRELLVRAMHRPKARRRTRPTPASRQRRLEEKRRRAEVKARRGAEE
jgi:ribosome-associated protein